MEPLLKLVNETASGARPTTGPPVKAAMGGGSVTVVTWETVLLARLASKVAVATVTEFVIEPTLVAVTVMAKFVTVLVPRSQKMMPPIFVQPGEAETKPTPAGKVSVTLTLE